MSKKLTPFESLLKEKMAEYEAPYDVKSWYGIDKKMNVHARSSSPWIVAVAATLVVSSAVGFGMYKYRYSPSEALLVNTSSVRFHQASANNVRGIQYAQAQVADLVPLEEINTTTPKSVGTTTNKYAATDLPTDANDRPVVPEVAVVPASTSKALTFESTTREGCAGVEIDFKANNGPTGGSYLWNFGDGKFSKEANPKHKFSKPGKYDVSLSVTSNDGQISTAVLNDMIVIYPAPDANFQWKFINNNPAEVAVEIVNTSNNASKLEWKFEDGTVSTNLNPIKNIAENGNYSVVLEVSNDFGCKDDVMKQISVNTDAGLGASKTFYPEREIFMPSGLKNKDSKFELTIYNMQNEQVYQTTQFNKGWTGKLKDGSTANTGQYKWKVVLAGNQSEQKYFSGEFTVFP